MAIEVKVPDMGESVIEATVARWMKQEGDPVSAGEPLVELETDKINLEVGAQQAGTLQQINKQAGETVAVGDVLALVAEEAAGTPQGGPGVEQAEAVDRDAVQHPAQQQPSQPQEKVTASEPPRPVAPVPPITERAPAPNDQRATPVAQRMAQDKGIDLAHVNGSGPGGRITKEDVEAYLQKNSTVKPAATVKQGAAETETAERIAGEKQTAAPERLAVKQAAPASMPVPPPEVRKPASSPAAQPEGRETREHMSRRRQTIARRLVEAQQTAAMLTTFNEIDMGKVIDLRKRRREEFKKRFGVDLGYMSFFVKASVAALKAFPYVNAEIQGDEIVLKHYYDIGVAIGAEEGLVVPVIRDADRLNFAGIETAIREYVDKVKNSTLTLEDLRGGTFTITNGGVYGSLMSTPILNPPQVGILGMHAIKERAMVETDQIVSRPMMYVALSYDHRIVDGREAVQFLVRIKELIEDPETLLFG